jgi:hypothetical protein
VKRRKCWLVLGIVDSNGALHHHKLLEDEDGLIPTNNPAHEELWPMAQKRWRFKVSDWELNKSILSKGNLTQEECEQIEALMRRILPVPRWVRHGDAWVAAGRPARGTPAWRKMERAFQKKYPGEPL